MGTSSPCLVVAKLRFPIPPTQALSVWGSVANTRCSNWSTGTTCDKYREPPKGDDLPDTKILYGSKVCWTTARGGATATLVSPSASSGEAATCIHPSTSTQKVRRTRPTWWRLNPPNPLLPKNIFRSKTGRKKIGVTKLSWVEPRTQHRGECGSLKFYTSLC